METIATNSIILSEDTGGKGRQFRARFLQAGLVKYSFGVCLLTKDVINKFIATFIGCPVIIDHSDVTDENAKDKRVGVVSRVDFNDNDGWFWCEGIIFDDKAIELINNGYNVSCQYEITEYAENTEGKLHNGIPYDKVILNGKFEHLAIVDNPRYEGAMIAVNAIMARNDKWITIKPNGEENKGKHMLLKDGESPQDAMHRMGWYEKRKAGEDKYKSFEEHKRGQEIDEKIYKERTKDMFNPDGSLKMEKPEENTTSYKSRFEDIRNLTGTISKDDKHFESKYRTAETRLKDKIEHWEKDIQEETKPAVKKIKERNIEVAKDELEKLQSLKPDKAEKSEDKEENLDDLYKKVEEQARKLYIAPTREENEKNWQEWKKTSDKIRELEKKRQEEQIKRERETAPEYKGKTEAEKLQEEKRKLAEERYNISQWQKETRARRKELTDWAGKGSKDIDKKFQTAFDKRKEQIDERIREINKSAPEDKQKGAEKLSRKDKQEIKSIHKDLLDDRKMDIGHARTNEEVEKIDKRYNDGIENLQKEYGLSHDELIGIIKGKETSKQEDKEQNNKKDTKQLKLFNSIDIKPILDYIENYDERNDKMNEETRNVFDRLIGALKAKNEADKKAENEDVDKRDIIRQIMAIAGKDEASEDVKTIAKLAEKLAYDKSEAGTADNKAKNEDDKREEEKADNKCAKNEDVDKRKLIDEVGGILKGKVDDEVFRTIIGKLEKVAYDKSEAGTADNKAKNEDDEYKKLEDEVEKKADNCKAKNSMDALKDLFYTGEVRAPKAYKTQAERIELGKKLF